MADTKDTQTEFAKALLEAQKAMGTTVTKDKANPAFKGVGYATLGAVLDVVTPALNANGIVLRQPTTFQRIDGSNYCVTQNILTHVNGYSEAFTSIMAAKDTLTAQESGSLISYNRRYSLNAYFALASADDDGNEASGVKSKKTEAKVKAEATDVWAAAIREAKGNPERLAKAREAIKTQGFTPEQVANLNALIEDVSRG